MEVECTNFTICRIARMLKVPRAGCYLWPFRRESLSISEQRRRDLAIMILACHRDSNGTYGARRITSDLCEMGEPVSPHNVATRIRELGIERISPRNFKVVTTLHRPSAT
ncbi:MAG: IS3 family transposase [Acidimicrobiales bacterium]